MNFSNAETEIQKELLAQERILWSGVPHHGLIFRSNETFHIPFSILWLGFAVFWEVSAWLSGAPPFFLLWGSFFVVAGLYFAFGRFIYDMKLRQRSYYGLTDKRIVIVSTLFGRKIKALNLSTLGETSIDTKNDGTGTITFGPTSFMGGAGWPSRGMKSPSFDRIPDVRRVYELIIDAQSKVKA